MKHLKSARHQSDSTVKTTTMTEQHTTGASSPVTGDSAAGGSEAISPYPTALQKMEGVCLPSGISRSTPLPSIAESTVDVLVAGQLVRIPEHALSEPLSVLQLTTEGHVRLQDYAEAVAWTLGALTNCGVVIFRV
jgi:hypothetical protein